MVAAFSATGRARPPQVLFVNGASSAGKTSLIGAVQERVGVPFLHVGLDHFFAAVPDSWGSKGSRTEEGFGYREFTGPDGLPYTEIPVGRAGGVMYAAYRRSLVTMLEHGARLAVDEMLLTAGIGADYVRLLAPFDVQYVLMTADISCLEARCATRRYRPGFGRWTAAAGGHLPVDYELAFDTSAMSPADCADAVLATWPVPRRE